MNDVWHLHSVDWMRELSGRELEGLLCDSERVDLDRSATLFDSKTPPHSLYLLERGLVRIYALSPDGDETTLAYVAPGEVFGGVSVFGDVPRETFARAVHPSRVWKIPPDAFRGLLKRRPTRVLVTRCRIGYRSERIESRIEDLIFRDVRSRVARVLLEFAERFGMRRREEVVVDLEVSEAEIATLVGSTPRAVGESLRAFEEHGWIDRDGRRLVVVKPPELERLAPGRSETAGPGGD